MLGLFEAILSCQEPQIPAHCVPMLPLRAPEKACAPVLPATRSTNSSIAGIEWRPNRYDRRSSYSADLYEHMV
jgi:hypothetical protein